MVHMRMCEVDLNNYILLYLMRINDQSWSEEPLINSWVATFPLQNAWYTFIYERVVQTGFMGMYLIFT